MKALAYFIDLVCVVSGYSIARRNGAAAVDCSWRITGKNRSGEVVEDWFFREPREQGGKFVSELSFSSDASPNKQCKEL